jgi:tetratricopeptide (TPR) repeat protein
MLATLLVGLLCAFGKSQTKRDSLLNLLKSAKEDTLKATWLNRLAWEYYLESDSLRSLNAAGQALRLSERLNYKNGIGSSLNTIGSVYDWQKNYDAALRNYAASLKARTEAGNKKGMAASHQKIGYLYWSQYKYSEAIKELSLALGIREEMHDNAGMATLLYDIGFINADQGSYAEAIRNYFAALRIREEIKDEYGIGEVYNNLGLVYWAQGRHEEALKNYFASLKIRQKLGNKSGVGDSYNNIGIIYKDQADAIVNPDSASKKNALYLKALDNYTLSLALRSEIGDSLRIADSYNNIGVVYKTLGNVTEALKMQMAGLDIRTKQKYLQGIAMSYNNIGILYRLKKKYKESERYLMDAISISRDLRLKELLKLSYNALTELNLDQGNYRDAFENYKKTIAYYDSLTNDENLKKSVQTQLQYEFDKKEALLKEEQLRRAAIASEASKKQRLWLMLIASVAVSVTVIALIVFRSLKLTRHQKTIIENQKHLVEEKQREILDSIHYARRIQKAIITNEKYFEKHIK